MKIEVKTKDCVYITINGTVYYIDDSTGERIMKKWKEKKKSMHTVFVLLETQQHMIASSKRTSVSNDMYRQSKLKKVLVAYFT